MPLLRRTAEDLDRERAERAAQNDNRRHERLKSHVVSGAVVFAFAQLAFGLLTGGPNLLGILVMAPFGAGVGFLATRYAWGTVGGTAAGFVLVGLFLGVLALVSGGSALSVPWIIVGAATSGGIPGCFVGFHVQHAL